MIIDLENLKYLVDWKGLDETDKICINNYLLQGYICPSCRSGGCTHWQKVSRRKRWYK